MIVGSGTGRKKSCLMLVYHTSESLAMFNFVTFYCIAVLLLRVYMDHTKTVLKFLCWHFYTFITITDNTQANPSITVTVPSLCFHRFSILPIIIISIINSIIEGCNKHIQTFTIVMFMKSLWDSCFVIRCTVPLEVRKGHS